MAGAAEVAGAAAALVAGAAPNNAPIPPNREPEDAAAGVAPDVLDVVAAGVVVAAGNINVNMPLLAAEDDGAAAGVVVATGATAAAAAAAAGGASPAMGASAGNMNPPAVDADVLGVLAAVLVVPAADNIRPNTKTCLLITLPHKGASTQSDPRISIA